MSFYWSGKAPTDAVFAVYPFATHVKTLYSHRVVDLPDIDSIKTIKRTFFPDKQQWVDIIHKSLTNKDLQKVVLARCCEIECEKIPHPFAVAAALLSRAKNSIVFCFANETMAFLGATPELLFSRKGREITCEAIAGTSLIGHHILNNEKLRSEILPVIEYIQENLSPFCVGPIQVSPIHLRETSNVQHLCATLHGKLLPAITDDQIIHQLHPTPALCGVPKKQAMNWIEKCEPFERGLYGGIVGWSTAEESVWAVGIRSCLIQGNIVKLYTGAGIVKGSNPDDEWEELNRKMNLYQDIFIAPEL